MKKLIVSVCLVLFGAVAGFAQGTTPVETPAVDNPNQAEIKFTKLVHDYGKIEKEANGESEFEFQNVGKEPLVLSDARSSCGCTVPSWTREPILPGKKGSIKVKYDTKRVGPINKTVTVLSNAKTSSVVLRIQGEVVDSNPASPEKPATAAPAPH
ncbi:MAG: DUF1573 domain-containing protein [Bacteroidota bacterium]